MESNFGDEEIEADTAVEPSIDLAASELPPNARPPRPQVWPISIVLTASLVAYLVASVFAVVLASFVVHRSIDPVHYRSTKAIAELTQSRIGFPLMVIVPQVAMVIPAIVASSVSPLGIRGRLRLVKGRWPIWVWCLAALATPLIGLISSIMVGLFMEDSPSLVEMTKVFRGLSDDGFLIPLAFLIGATPGLCEELLFRGYMQSRLTMRWGGVIGILATSLLFAVFHMDIVHSTAVFALGVWLGWIAWQSDSLYPAMLAHFFNNSLSVVAVAIGPEPGNDEPSLVNGLIMLAILAIGTSSLAGTVVAALRFRDSAAIMPQSV